MTCSSFSYGWPSSSKYIPQLWQTAARECYCAPASVFRRQDFCIRQRPNFELEMHAQVFPMLLDLNQYAVVDQKTQHVGPKAL